MESMRRETKDRLELIDIVKIAMMLTVVFYHACMFFTGNWFLKTKPVYTATYIANFAEYLNMFHVQTFTMASGFLFYYLKSIGKYNDFYVDIKKRAKRLLLPYLIVMVTWVIPFYIFYNGFDLKKIIYKYILGCAPSQLWFLPMLFWQFIFFYYLFNKRVATFKGMIIMIAISIVGGAVANKIFIVNFFQINTAIAYAMYFYLGAFLYEKGNQIKKTMTGLSILVSIGSFGIYKYFEGIENYSSIALIAKNICSIMSVVMIYLIISKLHKKYNFKSKCWKRLKNDSMGIYLFHQQIIYLTIIPLNGKVHPLVQVFISFFVAIIGAGFLIYILRQSKILKKLYGL